MSNSDQEKAGQPAISHLIHSLEKDLGEFTVRRTLPSPDVPMVGPWIFFDHMGPVTFSPGQGVSVRPHPHINLATVTYLFEGEILHRDSLGYEQQIVPGDLNLMVAGKGIVHSERERPEVKNQEHRLHGLQLWLGLPEEDEEIDPAFYHYPASEIPGTEIEGVPVRVMMGEAYGLVSPVKTFAKTLYLEADLVAGQKLVLPETEERAVYVGTGAVEIEGQKMAIGDMAVLGQNPQIQISCLEDARIALIGGEPIGKRHLFWNFASSRSERIEQAKEDWKNGRFPKVPGDEKEFIPLP